VLPEVECAHDGGHVQALEVGFELDGRQGLVGGDLEVEAVGLCDNSKS